MFFSDSNNMEHYILPVTIIGCLIFYFVKRRSYYIDFPVDKLKPIKPVMTGLLFENIRAHRPRFIYHTIDINLEDFEYESHQISSRICLDLIAFKIRNYNELENQSFTFPVNPKHGYIDGFIEIFGKMLYLDVTQIRFGTLNDNVIPTEITYQIQFEIGKTGFKNTPIQTMSFDLSIDSISIDEDILDPENNEDDAAITLIDEFIECAILSAPEIENNKFKFRVL